MSSSQLLPVEPIHPPRIPPVASPLTAPASHPLSPSHPCSKEEFERSCMEDDREHRSSAENGGRGDIIVPQFQRYGGTATQCKKHSSVAEDSASFSNQGNEDKHATSTWRDRFRRFLLARDPLLYSILKWTLAMLLLLFLTFIVFGLLYSGFRYKGNCTVVSNDSTDMSGKKDACNTPFGTILGAYDGVYGYSNCNDNYVSAQNEYMNLTASALQTGLAWQCVEYARRYWMLRGRPKPAYFSSVPGAADIWNLTFVTSVSNPSETLPLHRFKNGDPVTLDEQKPQVGDIVIYPIQSTDFPYGHVAVIAGVELGNPGAVYVAEQNWANTVWPSPYHNYTRKISLFLDKTNRLTLEDKAGTIIGWMRYSSASKTTGD